MIGRWTPVWLAALGAASTAGGCFNPSSTTCADGRICPPDSRCDDVGQRCIPRAQELPCVGLPEGDNCTFANAAGACQSGVCELFYCGDGLIKAPESCDGAPPFAAGCLDYGFDRGILGCSSACEPALDGCANFGWSTGPLIADWVTGIWGSGPEDVIAVGNDSLYDDKLAILHWDGVRWYRESVGIPPVNGVWGIWAVWGSAPRDVFIVGQNGTILHSSGGTWSTVPSHTVESLQAVWGSGKNDAFAVGMRGTILHWDGRTWGPQSSGSVMALNGVWGSGPDNVFAVGDGGTILRWDGIGWMPMALDVPDVGSLRGVWGSGPDDVFAVGSTDFPAGSVDNVGILLHWDGTLWSEIPTPPTLWLFGIWGSARDDIFVAGNTNVATEILHWDGNEWTVMSSFALDSQGRIWGSGPGDVFLTGGPVIHHGPGTTESTTTEETLPAGTQLNAVWGSDAFEDVIAAGMDASKHGAVARWDGKKWSVEAPTSPPLPPLERIWAATPTDLFVTSGPATFRGSGSSWVAIGQSPVLLHAIWGTSADDVIVAGNEGAIRHWDGAGWKTVFSDPSLASQPLRDLWGSGSGDVFAVGDLGLILHWDGASWRRMTSGTEVNLSSVWGAGPNDVFAGGDNSTILHWDGTRWSSAQLAAPPLGTVDVFRGRGQSDLFACVGGWLIHGYLGAWEGIALPPYVSCGWIHVTPRRVFVVGSQATVIDRPSVTCVGPERDCHDGWDNDCDGLQDGADPDCAGATFIGGSKVSEQCANLADDDGDGKADCADPDCADFPSCKAP